MISAAAVTDDGTLVCSFDDQTSGQMANWYAEIAKTALPDRQLLFLAPGRLIIDLRDDPQMDALAAALRTRVEAAIETRLDDLWGAFQARLAEGLLPGDESASATITGGSQS
jgi:hypothetical protein